MRKLETWVNVSIIVAALVFTGTTVKNNWLPKLTGTIGASATTESHLIGSQLQMDGVQWGGAAKTVVMALSTQCHFCQESGSFYKALTGSPAVISKRVAVVMVFPQPQSEAESFAKAYEIRATKVLSMPLRAFGASSTPTLMLVDRTGKVEKLWIGVLSDTQKKNLLGDLAKVS